MANRDDWQRLAAQWQRERDGLVGRRALDCRCRALLYFFPIAPSALRGWECAHTALFPAASLVAFDIHDSGS
ncbi:MAG: hypothetical protein ACR2GA_00240 [Chloroflexota bacterium]